MVFSALRLIDRPFFQSNHSFFSDFHFRITLLFLLSGTYLSMELEDYSAY